jgi:hypothetical protein
MFAAAAAAAAAAGSYDPPVGRQTSVVVLARDDPLAYRLVVTLSTRAATEAVDVDAATGALAAPAATHRDEGAALAAAAARGFRPVARGAALLGFAATGAAAGALLATRLELRATLPGGHAVLAVAEAAWALLPLAPRGAGPAAAAAAAAAGVAAGDAGAAAAAALAAAPPAEAEFWRALQAAPLAGTHYFCETADLTRPFPSAAPPGDPDPEFVWNAWLAAPLAAVGLPRHCPPLLQGAAEARRVGGTGAASAPLGAALRSGGGGGGGGGYALALLARRSRRHPGTRYLARGLNALAGPGNEAEAELVVWAPPAGGGGGGSAPGGGPVRWARCAWRRGTVPIRWGVTLAPVSRGMAAEVWVDAGGAPFAGALSYFRALRRRFGADGRGGGAVDGGGGGGGGGSFPEDGADGGAPVVCLNLLHCSPRKAGELALSEAFQAGVRGVEARLAGAALGASVASAASASSGAEPAVRVLSFDWHGVIAQLGEERGVAAFWHWVRAPLRGAGLAAGAMLPAGAPPAAGELASTPWGPAWRMAWTSRQRGVLRFNCADSLDRTNAATCFAMLPALQEAARLVGARLDTAAAGEEAAAAAAAAPGGSAGNLRELGRAAGAEEEEELELPPGWVVRSYGGRRVYVDRTSRTTQWEPPPGARPAPRRAPPPHTASAPDLVARAAAAAAPWAFFGAVATLDDARARLDRAAVAAHVGAFRRAGDALAGLYTGSGAMHSQLLSLLLPPEARAFGAAAAGVGRLQNLRVAVHRRWNNAVSDAARQGEIEAFLGLNLAARYPGVRHLAPPCADLAGPDADDRGWEAGGGGASGGGVGVGGSAGAVSRAAPGAPAGTFDEGDEGGAAAAAAAAPPAADLLGDLEPLAPEPAATGGDPLGALDGRVERVLLLD